MQFIAVLIALAIDRLTRLGSAWQLNRLLQRWLRWLADQDAVANILNWRYGWWLLALLPAVVVGLVLGMIDHGLVELLVGVIILLVSFQAPQVRQAYRNWLQQPHAEHQRALQEALEADVNAVDLPRPVDLPQALLWVNFKHYGAPIIVFAVLGAAAALAYVILREMQRLNIDDIVALDAEYADSDDADDRYEYQQAELARQAWQQLPWPSLWLIVDWLPVRLATAGMLLVGNFSRGLPQWLASFSQPRHAAAEVLYEVAYAASDSFNGDNLDSLHQSEASAEHIEVRAAQAAVKMAKRNLFLVVVVLAVLTLSGYLY